MAYPRPPVSQNDPEQEHPAVEAENTVNHEQQKERRADEMRNTRASFAVLCEVVGVEVFERFVDAFGHSSCVSPKIQIS